MQKEIVLPEAFCWTRFGTEAGEGIYEILRRKELERRANDGVFYWGIGSSVAPGIAALLELTDFPEVLFSPIRGRPRRQDASPPEVFKWTRARTLHGERIAIPEAVLVTSGGVQPTGH